MGKTDRSPLMGKKVERDPGVARKHLTEILERFRMPTISAKTTAFAVTALVLCAAVITVSVIGGIKTPVRAADIYIGTDTATASESYLGVGRFTEMEDEIGDETDVPAETEPSEDSEDSAVKDEPQSPENENETEVETETEAEAVPESGRYTVTFAFSTRDSISCSAEEPASVAELAERLGITFNSVDVLNLPTDTVISEDTVITTDKVTYTTVTVKEAIPFDTKYVDDSSLYRGNTKVSQYGQNGENVTEYEVKYVNGVEESRTEVRTYTAKKPVQQIVRRGTAVYTPPVTSNQNNVTYTVNEVSGTIVGSDGNTYKYSGYIDVRATMYYSGGNCANGMPADERVIAVDPSVIPLGTQVYITGDYAEIGVRTAADTGGSIKGNIIDICFDRGNPLAAGFGFKPMRVYILE